MKKILCIGLALALLCVFGVNALAESEDALIRVTGNATVTLTADTATLQIGVNTRKDTVQAAQGENAAVMSAVIEAIRRVGIGDQELVTSHFNVYSSTDYSYDAAGGETRTPYYQVENMLYVTVRDLSLIGPVLDAAVAAGANTMYGITFSSTQENEAYQKALTRAVEDAAVKARVLAEASGKELGELRVLDASQGEFYYGIQNVYDEKAAASGAAIVSGDVSVTANVVLEYTAR